MAECLDCTNGAVDGTEYCAWCPIPPYPDDAPEIVRTVDHRGMVSTHCAECGVMVILFDDDVHYCEEAGR